MALSTLIFIGCKDLLIGCVNSHFTIVKPNDQIPPWLLHCQLTSQFGEDAAGRSVNRSCGAHPTIFESEEYDDQELFVFASSSISRSP